jgi:Ankyrin repeats (3 copies)
MVLEALPSRIDLNLVPLHPSVDRALQAFYTVDLEFPLHIVHEDLHQSLRSVITAMSCAIYRLANNLMQDGYLYGMRTWIREHLGLAVRICESCPRAGLGEFFREVSMVHSNYMSASAPFITLSRIMQAIHEPCLNKISLSELNFQTQLRGHAPHPKQSAMQRAAYRDRTALFERLLEHGACVNAPTVELDTALCAAAGRADLRIAQMLLQAGANVDARDPLHNKTVLEVAANNGRLDLVHYLLRNKRGPDNKEQRRIAAGLAEEKDFRNVARYIRNWKHHLGCSIMEIDGQEVRL